MNEGLASLDGRFGEIHLETGRPSIPPEQLLQAFPVRSERRPIERLDFDLLFRCSVGLGIDDPVCEASTVSENRDRLLDGSVTAAFRSAVLVIPRVKGFLSQDHVSVDGTLFQAWAERGQGPRRARLGGRASGGVREECPPQRRRHVANPSRATRGRARCPGGRPRPPLSKDTHQTSTDPDARLDPEGQGSQAVLQGARAHGEPPWTDRGRLRDQGRRPRRAHRGSRHGRDAGRPAGPHPRTGPQAPRRDLPFSRGLQPRPPAEAAG